MGSVEDPRPRPIQPEVPRQKVMILDLNGLMLRTYKGVAEAERAREFGHLPVSLVGSRLVYVPRVGVSRFLAAMATDFTLIIWTSRMSRNTHLPTPPVAPATAPAGVCGVFGVHPCVQENVITQRVMETLAANSQQPPEELVHEVTALEARRANMEATLTRMGSVEDPRSRPIQLEVPRQKVLILDLNGLLLRLCKGVAEREREGQGVRPPSCVSCWIPYGLRSTSRSF
ncbi:hypothetical protein R1flu_014989 [Riccia fluitans]|uniref:FCP1 homology domain-containing protein n=1 Tax=Riccia fluitans TaxID=41844 RepID=A0ABD1YHN9_9MARC